MRSRDLEPRHTEPILVPVPDVKALRRVMGRFATGITVVTVGGPEPHYMTANAFTSVSLDPPLVLVCVQRTATLHKVIHESGSFAVSVLAANQEQEARIFAAHHRPRVAEFVAVDVVLGPYSGAPVFCDALAWLECELAAVYDGGDHSIFIGRVQTLGHSAEEDALLFYNGGFRRLAAEATLPDTA
jgi:flavin reductase (DIM6/NTAB) family NADH-FMN oxidoreductase RutF